MLKIVREYNIGYMIEEYISDEKFGDWKGGI